MLLLYQLKEWCQYYFSRLQFSVLLVIIIHILYRFLKNCGRVISAVAWSKPVTWRKSKNSAANWKFHMLLCWKTMIGTLWYFEAGKEIGMCFYSLFYYLLCQELKKTIVNFKTFSCMHGYWNFSNFLFICCNSTKKNVRFFLQYESFIWTF